MSVQAFATLGASEAKGALSNGNGGDLWQKPIISKPGTEAELLAQQLVQEVTLPGISMYHNYVERYETKLDQALAKRKQLAAKTVTHRKRQTAIQRAIAEHAASSTSPSGRLVPLPSDDEEEDSECSEDEGRQGNDLLDFIEEQTAHVDKSSPLQPWDVDRIKDRLSHDLSLRPGAGAATSAGPSVFRLFQPPKAAGPTPAPAPQPQRASSPALQLHPSSQLQLAPSSGPLSSHCSHSATHSPVVRRPSQLIPVRKSMDEGGRMALSFGPGSNPGDNRQRAALILGSASSPGRAQLLAGAPAGPRSDSQQVHMGGSSCSGAAVGRTGRSAEHTAEGLRRLTMILGPGGLGSSPSASLPTSLSVSADMATVLPQPPAPPAPLSEPHLSSRPITASAAAAPVQHGRRAGTAHASPSFRHPPTQPPAAVPQSPASSPTATAIAADSPGLPTAREGLMTPAAAAPPQPPSYFPSMWSGEQPARRRSVQGLLPKDTSAPRSTGGRGHAAVSHGATPSGSTGSWWAVPGHEDRRRVNGTSQSGSWKV